MSNCSMNEKCIPKPFGQFSCVISGSSFSYIFCVTNNGERDNHVKSRIFFSIKIFNNVDKLIDTNKDLLIKCTYKKKLGTGY